MLGSSFFPVNAWTLLSNHLLSKNKKVIAKLQEEDDE